MPTPDEWRQKKLEEILKAASHAIDRSRYIFIASNVTGVVILVGLFNATYPWIRNSLERAKAGKTWHVAHFEKVLSQDLWVINIPVIGMKASVFDLSVIGSVALLIISVWQYYCVRRETQIVRIVCEEAKKAENFECLSYLYHGIAHLFVFTTRFYKDDHKFAGAIIVILMFMPGWLPILIIINDIYTLFVPAPHSISQEPLFWEMQDREQIEAVIRITFGFIVGSISLYYCARSKDHERQTREHVELMERLVMEGGGEATLK